MKVLNEEPLNNKTDPHSANVEKADPKEGEADSGSPNCQYQANWRGNQANNGTRNRTMLYSGIFLEITE